MPDVQTGSIKWFDVAKGYGFIIPDNRPAGERDIFFHSQHLVPGYWPTEGDRVQFKAANDRNGRPRAKKVAGIK